MGFFSRLFRWDDHATPAARAPDAPPSEMGLDAATAQAVLAELDIDSAINAHENWKNRLLAVMEGRSDERLDPASLAHAAVAIRRAVDDGAQLICVNKFGAQEALGSGLREEIGLVVAAGIPLLTAVGKRFLPEWQEFAGDYGELLPPEREAILAWCARVCAG